MKLSTIKRICGISIIAGSVLFFIYALCTPLLLPVGSPDFSKHVLDPNWEWLAFTALAGILLMIFGFAGVYSGMYASSGVIGLLGIIFIELAYILQACQVSWEAFVYPVLAGSSSWAPLLRDRILISSPIVRIFRFMCEGSILIGIVVFCTALLRSREYPGIAAIFILIGAAAYALGGFVSVYLEIAGIFVLSAGSVALGIKLTGKTAG